ncbi:MAG: electron transfer flavoprotein subunit alpha/FixB family protein [Calditrichia bacterium]
MAHILVVCETRDQKIKKVSFEALNAAWQLAESLKADVSALLIGAGVKDLAPEAGKFGAQTVYVVDSPELQKFSPDVFARVIADAAQQIGATHIFMGATIMGKDVLPRVAFHLNGAVAQDIIGIEVQDGKVIYTRPIIAGKLISKITLTSAIQFATVRPNIYKAEEKPANAEIVDLSVEIPQARAVVENVLAEKGGKLDVTEADIIVSGGRGMKGPENWHLIEGLAELLDAATGASRAVVDAGWRDHSEQVGQTGKTVSPNLYIACGISGAIQHQAGMSSSKYIVAINKDPEAPIFKIADYGVVGDVFEVLPKLIEEIGKLKSES